jgi:hypothetical protein
VVSLLFLLNFYGETLFYRPGSLHQWRQADCLSITKNYYEEGMHFLEPKIHSSKAPNNKAVSEFPLVNYTVALLWKVFGEHEFIYRLLEYVIYLLAVFLMFNTMLRFFNLRLSAFFLTSLVLTSPLLTYYSFNFLSDVPALSFCIMAFCFLFWFYKTKSPAYFYLALLLATLAVLLKASALIALVCICFFYLTDLLKLGKWLGTGSMFRHKLLPLASIILCIYLVNSWYTFALRYNTFNNGFFLLTILPIWDMPEDAIFDTLRQLFNNLLPSFLNRPMLALFFCMIVVVFFHFKKLDAFLRYSFLITLLFFIAYLLVFFKVFNVHDYYLTNLFIFPVVTFFCVMDILSKTVIVIPSYMKVILPVVFFFNAFNSAALYRLRTINDDKLCVWYPFISPVEKQLAEYAMWDYHNHMYHMEDLRADLRKLGISRSDSVLCLIDEAPNVALYFMDQKGYSFSREQVDADSLLLKKLLPKQVPYLVLTDSNLRYEKPFLAVSNHYEKIFTKTHVEVFKLKK